MGVVHAKQEAVVHKMENEEKAKLKLEKLKVNVDRIHFDGIVRTKDDVLQTAVKNIFSAKNLLDVIVESHNSKQFLESLGAFKEVSIFIDTCEGEKCTPDGLEVTFHMLETKRVTGGINTVIGNNSGGLSIVSGMPNLFGRGEKLQAEYSRGTEQTTNCNVTYMKPILNFKDMQFTHVVYQAGSDLPWSQMRQLDRGTLFELAFSSSPNFKHRLRAEGVWRDLSAMSPRIAFDIREDLGHSLKCSLKHSMVLDRRDDSILPRNGTLWKLNHELAALAGNMSFNKLEMEVQINKSLPLLPNTVLQASLFSGYLNAHSGNTPSIADKFFLGGPLSIRGFDMNGCGPSSQGCTLGSNSYWAGALHLFFPVPFLSMKKDSISNLFRTHLFINGGDIKDNMWAEILNGNISETLRLAYGFGILFRIGQAARFELNYCVPLRTQSRDRVRPGLQFGVGVSFL